MECKFKSGDIIKVARKGLIDWVDGMNKYINGTYKIKRICIYDYNGYILTSLIEGDELEYVFCEDSLELISELVTIKKNEDWNTKCSRCGAPAYIGLNNIECSRGCQ